MARTLLIYVRTTSCRPVCPSTLPKQRPTPMQALVRPLRVHADPRQCNPGPCTLLPIQNPVNVNSPCEPSSRVHASPVPFPCNTRPVSMQPPSPPPPGPAPAALRPSSSGGCACKPTWMRPPVAPAASAPGPPGRPRADVAAALASGRSSRGLQTNTTQPGRSQGFALALRWQLLWLWGAVRSGSVPATQLGQPRFGRWP
eukprot:131576-Chlamydomonas_euryale.AAC.3